MDKLLPDSTQHRKIYCQILGFIRTGKYAAGSRLPTEKDFTTEFGVSRITINRALNDLTRDGFIWRRQGSGSFVAAQKKFDLTIGVIIPGLFNHEIDSIFPTVLQHLVRQAAQFKWQILPGDPTLPGEPDAKDCKTVEVIRNLIDSNISGAIFVPHPIYGRGEALNHNVLAELQKAKITSILLDRDIVAAPRRSEWDLVCLDHERAGYDIGRHLIAQGCRRFVFVTEKLRFPTPHARLAGLRKALSESNLDIHDARILQGQSDSISVAHNIIKTHKADAVVCDNDYDAAIVMKHLLSAGAKIPKQIKITGFDNAPIGKRLAIPLTTIAQPPAALSYKALSTLRDRLSNKTLPTCTTAIHGRLIIRKSTS